MGVVVNCIARLFIAFSILVSAPAFAAKRVALLIGNANYKSAVGPLKNPHNDVRLVGNALRKVGFEVLTPVRDAKRTDILVAIHDFAKKLKQAGPDAVGFMYYSGHGVASKGENFIVPVDVAEVSSLRMSLGGVRQNEIVKILRDTAPQAVHYLVFDACRNNLGGARGNKGFVPVRQESGLLVAFATAPGQVATDLGDGGGPYAKALATEIVKPGVSDLLMFHRVRIAVKDATNGDQIPWTVDGISRRQRLYLGGPPTQSTADVKQSAAAKSSRGDAANAWSVIQNTESAAVLSRFAELYPRSVYAELARARLAELQQASTAAAAGQGNQTVAALNRNDPAAPLSETELARQLQTELKRVSCLDGPIDGVWGANSQAALDRFRKRAGEPAAAGGPSMAALASLKAQTKPVCPATEIVPLAGRWTCTGTARSFLAQNVPGIEQGALLARGNCTTTFDAVASGPSNATYAANESCRTRGVHPQTQSFRKSSSNNYKGRMWRKGKEIYIQNTWASSKEPEWDTIWAYSPVPTEEASYIAHATRFINDSGVQTRIVASSKCVRRP